MKIQGTLDLTRTGFGSQTVSKAAHGQSVDKGPHAGRELSAEQMWKEAVAAEEPALHEIEEAVEALNTSIEYINRVLRFTIHEDTQRVMVRVVDLETDEVIKEIPPEEVLDTVARIREMIGLLVDKWA
ncbi:MAG TPA: flagellar protein FlaG [Limnochordia bacterium]|nr:flagellar protein FlaG [Limnochordia bacterium]